MKKILLFGLFVFIATAALARTTVCVPIFGIPGTYVAETDYVVAPAPVYCPPPVYLPPPPPPRPHYHHHHRPPGYTGNIFRPVGSPPPPPPHYGGHGGHGRHHRHGH